MAKASEKKTKKKQVKFPSELRFDLTNKDWVVIATGRGKRPEAFKKETRQRAKVLKKDCPFCSIKPSENLLLAYKKGKQLSLKENLLKDWTTIVLKNKYPAFLPHVKLEKRTEGNLYQSMNAVGFCELVVTGDHEKSLAQLPIGNVKEVIDCFQQRYLDLQKLPFVNYISIFHNHGVEAGASQPHPHSQIITSPLIDIDLEKALANSQKYFEKKKECIYCQMNKWERKVKKRIVFENETFLAICPFASKAAFQVIISPKKHLPCFEEITEKEKEHLAQALKTVLSKLYKGLHDPAYNFYLKTSPSFRQKCDFYHWHLTILPKTSIWAGFEIGTRMEISTIAPEKAAQYLRKIK